MSKRLDVIKCNLKKSRLMKQNCSPVRRLISCFWIKDNSLQFSPCQCLVRFCIWISLKMTALRSLQMGKREFAPLNRVKRGHEVVQSTFRPPKPSRLTNSTWREQHLIMPILSMIFPSYPFIQLLPLCAAAALCFAIRKLLNYLHPHARVSCLFIPQSGHNRIILF